MAADVARAEKKKARHVATCETAMCHTVCMYTLRIVECACACVRVRVCARVRVRVCARVHTCVRACV